MEKDSLEKGKGKSKKWLRNTLIIIVLALAVFVYIRYFFVFGTGVKEGQLNYVVHKGYVFKTYEGKLIQAGFNNSRSDNSSSVIKSNEFEFSIADKEIADSLMLCGGRNVELRYKEYLSSVPWRGYSKYVVDKIVAVK